MPLVIAVLYVKHLQAAVFSCLLALGEEVV